MEKRRLIGQLPVIQQTETLKKFFGSTLDQVFQPGKAESLTGYIGQRTAYSNPETDFYIAEPTRERQAHQLVPAMISRDAQGAITDLQFYDDLINYLAANGGNVSDPNRLFSGEYYAWAPPVDMDKLLNPQQYYWFGDNPLLVPALTLAPGFTRTVAANHADAFPVPPRMPGVDPARETIMAFVDGYPAEGQVSDPDADGACEFIFVKRPPTGAVVRVYRYGDMRQVLQGLTEFDPRPWTDETRVERLTSNMRLEFDDALAPRGFDRRPFEKSFVHSYTADPAMRDNPWDADHIENDAYWVEGVGVSIELISVNQGANPFARKPVHVVIDRRSADANPWSRNNFWVHHDAFAWSGKSFAGRSAKRPIIEFIKNLKLWNYGTHRLPNIQATISGDVIFCPAGIDPLSIQKRTPDRDVSDFDVLVYDSKGYDTSALIPIPVKDANNHFLGTIFVDQQHPALFGDRILVLDNDDPAFKNRILTVRHATQTVSDNDFGFGETRPIDPAITAEVLAFQVSAAPKKGDIVRMNPRGYLPFDLIPEGFDGAPWEYSEVSIEYWFDGARWKPAQYRHPEASDPLFDLATYAHAAHADLAGSTFAGNRVFGFALGDGATLDSVLGRVLSYDSFGQIVFENDVVTRKTLAAGAEVVGGQYYWTYGDSDDDSVYCDGWRAAADLTRQTFDAEGVASTPLNLTANPTNLQPEFLSRNQWFEHFNMCLKSQDDFAGVATAINNWRDSARDLSKGRAILQHRAPLLKAMLLASDERFDYFDAVRYAEREYIRFRAKFIKRAVDLNNAGTLDASATVDAWVDAVLASLRIEKSSDFPFALSGMAGTGNFIPPTPAFLGVAPAVEPGAEIDNSYSQPVTFLRGHDGSRVPAFGDFRDIVLLALEQRIYASISDKFKTTQAWIDLNGSIEGHSRRAQPGNNLYSRAELTAVLTPVFLRWVQANRLDYTANLGFEPNNPWTWNYRGVVGVDGDPLPGHWRGVYRWYFDTDRPHLAPWEMLGFPSKPGWFDAEYGPAPYTSDNLKLWTDLRDGRIAQGGRAGFDLRYARPDLLARLPVDQDGALRDPLAMGLVGSPVGPTLGMRPWVFGDQGPVENLWRLSPAFSFNMAEIAALLRPALWIEHNWDTENLDRVNGQWINTLTQNRPPNAALRVHGELASATSRVVRLGVQQWIADLMRSRNQNPAILGDAVRALTVQLAHKMAGFTQASNLRVFADNFGLIPSENVEVHYHEAPPYKQTFYSGVIIEWTGAGWRVVGYDNAAESFKIMPGDLGGPKTTISLGEDPAIYDWRASVYYPTGRMVDYKGAIYSAVVAHTSVNKFEAEFWRLETGVVRHPKVVVCDQGAGEIALVPYNTVFTTYQEVASFLRDYFRWLEAEGFVFDSLDPRTKEMLNWGNMIRQYLTWAQMNWKAGNFIALSAAAETLKFVSPHGTVYNVETTVNGRASLIDRAGRPVERRSTFVSRLDEETKIIATKQDLYGARLRLGEVEHVLVFSNKTVFNDLVYDPLLNLYQPRLRLLGIRATDWHGRRDAPGYIIHGDDLMPSFERASEDIRDMFDIENSPNAEMRDHARHVIGYQKRDYLDNLLVSETQQFEFFQGVIQQKGAAGVFSKLMRSHLIDRDRDLSFLEEWAFKAGAFGALTNIVPVAFTLVTTDVRCSRQLIKFGEDHEGESVIGLTAADPRWVERPASDAVFAAVRPRDEFPYFNDGLDEQSFERRGFDPTPPPGGPQVQQKAKWLQTAGYVRRTEVNLAAFDRSLLTTLYTQAVAQGKTVGLGTRIWVYDRGDGTFTVYAGFVVGTIGNRLDQIVGQSTDASLLASETRLIFAAPHGFDDRDVQCPILLAGQVNADTTIAASGTLEGFHTVLRIEDRHAVIIDSGSLTSSSDFTTNNKAPPAVYIFREVRFPNRQAAHDFWLRFEPEIGSYSYVDNANTAGDWAVYQWNVSEQLGWDLLRQRPQKIDAEQLVSAAIYDNRTVLNSANLTVNPPLLEGMPIIDLVQGLLPGAAETELTYRGPQDPAEYFDTSSNMWGREQVGQLWWDTSTMRVLEVETDVLDASDARTAAEMSYRLANWGKFAPGSTIDVYEWTRSYAHPKDYKLGVLLHPEEPIYVATIEFDAPSAARVYVYYFWVLNPRVTPQAAPRAFSAAQVADMLANAASGASPWIAPIAANALVAGGLEPYLNSLSSVLQLNVAVAPTENNVHTEWELLRPKDTREGPPDYLWSAMRDSLAGFNDVVHQVPDPTLPAAKAVGLGKRPLQTLFADGRPGQLRGRRSFIAMLNAILARSPMLRENSALLPYLSAATPTFEKLIWTQRADAPDVVAPPVGSYDYTVASIAERDALMRMPEFYNDVRVRATTRRNPRILVTNLEGDQPSWSVWSVDLDGLRAAMELEQAYTVLVTEQSVEVEIAAEDAGFIVVEELDLANADPQTSLALAGVIAEEPRADLQAYLTLAGNYDIAVDTVADARDLIAQAAVSVGQRVLIRADDRADGFWTVFAYNPEHQLAGDDGYVFENAQLYRTRDFWTAQDWYADGQSPLNPPLVTYATLQARDLAEFPDIRHTFVKVKDDGRGAWCWSVYENGGWTVVARENGTLALSSRFYDATRAVYGVVDNRISQIAARDGSWELRMLVNAMRLFGLSAGEQNELFFSLLHFLHVQQDHVDWAFKTSYMSVVGFNEMLNQSAVQVLDNTDNLVSYLEEVKPYRVRIRDVSRVLTPDLDVANVQVFDFDKPLYYDAARKTFRRLDLAAPDDALIIQTDPLYKRWYDNYAKASFDPASEDFNPVRRLSVKLRFDRIDPEPTQPLDCGYGWDIHAFDYYRFDEIRDEVAVGGSAFSRLLAFYNPIAGMRTDVEDLLGLAFKGIQVDGGDLFVPKIAGDVSHWDIRAFDTLPHEALLSFGRDTNMDADAFDQTEFEILANPTRDDSYRLIDPEHDRWHPQELITTGSTTALAIHVHTEPTQGAPRHAESYVLPGRNVGDAILVNLGAIPATQQSVLVYRDGLRLPASEYVVNYFGQTVTVNRGLTRPSSISVHVFAAAGLTPILEQRLLTGDGGATYQLLAAPQGRVEAIVDGVRQPTSQLTISGVNVTLPAAAAEGADIMLNVRAFGAPQSQDTATRTRIDGYAYTSAKTWTMADPPQGLVQGHIGAIADVNGERLLPPYTRYGRFDALNRAFEFKATALADLRVWLDGTEYTGLIPVINNGVVSQHIPNGYVGKFGVDGWDDQDLFDVEGHLALIDAKVCAVSRLIQADEAIAVAYDDNHEYTVDGDQFAILRALDSNDVTQTVTWQNDALMDLQTHVFHGRSDATYVLNANVRDAFIVALNGKTLVKNIDYQTVFKTVDNLDWSGQPSGSFRTQIAVQLLGAQTSGDRLVVLAINGRPASVESDWTILSTRPNLSMVGDPVYGRLNGVQLVEESPLGPRNLYRLNGSWDVCHWLDAQTATLIDDLDRADATISLRIRQDVVAQEFQLTEILPTPNDEMNAPGVVWIAGERVEYFGLDIVDDVATLSRLRRGTRGTRIGVEKRRVAAYQADGIATQFTLADSLATLPVEVFTLDADGVNVYYANQRDYLLAQAGDDVRVAFHAAPPAGLTLYVAQSGNTGHRAGTKVRSAKPTQALDDCPFAIRDAGPAL